MIYCDTSLLVSVIAEEVFTDPARRWLSARSPGSLATSEWTAIEIASALSLKIRTGELDEATREQARSSWNTIRHEGFKVVEIEPVDFSTAMRMIDRHELGLRAGDALHLAIANNRGMRIATLDRRMAAAATIFGMRVETVIPTS